MAFSWHKLVPRSAVSTSIVCPPPCTSTTNGQQDCETWCVYNPSGTLQCVYRCLDGNWGGAQCGGQQVLGGGDRINPGAPLEMRLFSPLGCFRDNSASDQQAISPTDSVCIMGEVPRKQIYYYRTPNSPSQTPLTITGGNLCLKYNPYQIPDRLMVISGRNRYKYGGWNSDPNCNLDIPPLWDSSGASGIKQCEEAIGRGWHLPNSILDLPLFGADTSSNPATPPDPCNAGCVSQSCFSTRTNSGIGHFASGSVNQKGYYSFQCFNPQAFYGNTPVPTCSVWSWLHSTWRRMWSEYVDLGGATDEADFRSQFSTLATKFNTIFTTNPGAIVSGGANDGKVSLRVVLNDFINQANTDGGSLYWGTSIMPNVFLWDKDAYNAASTADKYKHLYIIGNANVIFDSQCLVGQGNNYASMRYGFTIHLDEVSHDPNPGSSGNARLLGFFGCDPDNSGNIGSVAYFELNTMNCVPTTSYCAECANVDFPPTSNCFYNGYQPDCSYNPP